MIRLVLFLAAANTPSIVDDGISAPTRMPRISPLFYDILTITCAAFFLGLLGILWAAYIRKPRRRSTDSRDSRDSRDFRHEPPVIPQVNREIQEVDGRKRIKIKERRRDHRPRNPTLSETGGLPPVKPDSPNPPAP